MPSTGSIYRGQSRAAGVRPSTKNDALRLLDQAYADAGTQGGDVFCKKMQRGGV